MKNPRKLESELVKDQTRGLDFLNLVVASFVLLMVCGCGPKETPSPFVRPKPAVAFKPQEMADALHAVIAADRQVYAQYFDQISGASGTKQSPLPAHLLREASEAVQQKGAEFHYVVRSLWPSNPKNAAETPTETAGLKAVLEHPDQNYYSEESLGGRRYFIAVYPDRAFVPSCVNCHNQLSASPKRDFKQGDVMGGMIVRVPLEF